MSSLTKAQLQKSLADALASRASMKADLKAANERNATLMTENQRLRSAPPKMEPVDSPVKANATVERIVRKGRVDDEIEIARLSALVSRLERERDAK